MIITKEEAEKALKVERYLQRLARYDKMKSQDRAIAVRDDRIADLVELGNAMADAIDEDDHYELGRASRRWRELLQEELP